MFNILSQRIILSSFLFHRGAYFRENVERVSLSVSVNAAAGRIGAAGAPGPIGVMMLFSCRSNLRDGAKTKPPRAVTRLRQSAYLTLSSSTLTPCARTPAPRAPGLRIPYSPCWPACRYRSYTPGRHLHTKGQGGSRGSFPFLLLRG